MQVEDAIWEVARIDGTRFRMNKGACWLHCWVQMRGPVERSLEAGWVLERPVGRSLDANGHWLGCEVGANITWVQMRGRLQLSGCGMGA